MFVKRLFKRSQNIVRKINLTVGRHMLNIAVIVNTLAVLLGSVLGTFIGNKLPENIRKILFQPLD